MVQAAPVAFEVQATGAQEVTPVDNPGSAFARFTFDEDTQELTFAVTVSGLSPNLVTASHIHRGAAGVNGPVVHFISDKGFTQAAGTIELSDEDVAVLMAGDFYLNVHSAEHPGGFARGQLIMPAAIAPPSTGDAGLLGSGRGGSSYLALVIAAATILSAAGLVVLTSRRA